MRWQDLRDFLRDPEAAFALDASLDPSVLGIWADWRDERGTPASYWRWVAGGRAGPPPEPPPLRLAAGSWLARPAVVEAVHETGEYPVPGPPAGSVRCSRRLVSFRLDDGGRLEWQTGWRPPLPTGVGSLVLVSGKAGVARRDQARRRDHPLGDGGTPRTVITHGTVVDLTYLARQANAFGGLHALGRAEIDEALHLARRW